MPSNLNSISQSPQIQIYIENMKKTTERGKAITVAVLVSSIAFTILGVVIGGIFGTLGALVGGFAAVISYDLFATCDGWNKMLDEPRQWIFLDLIFTQEVRDQMLIKTMKEASKESLLLKSFLPTILDEIRQYIPLT